jgi:methionyl-tRNA synthetase
LRYTLAINLPESRDSDFYLKDFQARTNNELADILGNFVNRTLAFIHKNFDGAVPPLGVLSKLDKEMVAYIKAVPERVGDLYEHYRFREGVIETMNLARAANKYFNDSEPWRTLKSSRERCSTTLHICTQVVRSLAILVEPVVPALAHALWTTLKLEGAPHLAGWESAAQMGIEAAHDLEKPEILVTKIEDKQIETMVQSLNAPPEGGPETQVVPIKPTISLDDFKKVDLRLARVVAAEKVAKSGKLIKLQVEMGSEKRQLVAGIAQHYKPEDLVGKLIVVVANLQAAKLMGNESQGMLLAASDQHGKLALLTVDAELSSGSTIK